MYSKQETIMNYCSIKTEVEIKGIEIDIEVYYEAQHGVRWADDPGEINVEIKSICRQGSTMPLSKLLSNKILKLYEPILHEYICENFADREI